MQPNDTRKRGGSKPKLPDVQCEQCGTTFHPRVKTRKFCSTACYRIWWKAHVKDAALETANEVKEQLVAEGTFHRTERGLAEKPNSRTVAAKRKRDEALLADPAHDDGEDIGRAWAERARYWDSGGGTEDTGLDPFNARKREQPPLVLNGHGVRLRVHNGCLVVRSGLTHYPQNSQELRYFPGDKKLPSRIIALDNDGSLTFDVITWLSRHQIPLIVLDWQANVVSVTGDGTVYDLELREAQLAARTNGIGLTLATKLIREKVAGQQEVLWSFWRTPARDNGLRKLQGILDELKEEPPTIDALRMIEARAALAYFLCWHEVPIQWKGTGRKPIPEEWRRCGLRKGINLDGTNRHATHPVNAMLNYAYQVLEGQTRIQIVSQGLDPTTGYMHASRGTRPALVFDLMEPLRPKVDQRVLDFVKEQTFSPGDVVVGSTGVCRLHPQLVRRVVKLGVQTSEIEKAVREGVRELTRCANHGAKARSGGLNRSGLKSGRASIHR